MFTKADAEEIILKYGPNRSLGATPVVCPPLYGNVEENFTYSFALLTHLFQHRLTCHYFYVVVHDKAKLYTPYLNSITTYTYHVMNCPLVPPLRSVSWSIIVLCVFALAISFNSSLLFLNACWLQANISECVMENGYSLSRR